MTNFSTNQVMQFYVADASTITTKGTDGKISAIKTIPGRGKVATFNNYAEPKKSDIIENILWAKVTKADALATPCKEVTLTINNAVKGENHIVRVSYPDVFGAGKESWTTKTVVGQATDTNTDSLQSILKEQLDAILPPYIAVKESSGGVLVFTANPDKAGYKRGFRPVVMPDFEISVNTVVEDGEDVQWATITIGKSTTTVSGTYKLADMEYFALGERGDEYRQMGWPDVVYEPEYKVEVGTEYNVLVVHYGYRGANDQSHLSEKDLIIASTALVSELAEFAKQLGAEKVSTVVEAEAGQKAETEA